MHRKITIFLIFVLTKTSICQTSFYVSNSNNDLVLADIKNCSYQVLCNTMGLIMYDIALTPDNTIYSTDGKKVYRINSSNCSNIQITDTVANNGAYINALVALDNNILIAASNDARLFKIDISSGTSFLIDTIKQVVNDSVTNWYSSSGDLTWYKGKLILASNGGQGSGYVEINLNQNYDKITNVHFVAEMVTFSNSIYGLLTVGDANCTSDNLKILAFEFGDIYIVNPTDATIQMYCSNIFPYTCFGAASVTETSEQVFTYKLEVPNIFTPNNDNVNDIFRPIVVENIEEIQTYIYDRWGILVYSSNEVNFKWNGYNFQNISSSDGTYFYILKIKSNCGDNFVMKNFVTLLK